MHRGIVQDGRGEGEDENQERQSFSEYWKGEEITTEDTEGTEEEEMIANSFDSRRGLR